jgi:Rrf2 family nitric oxide-sensitive transcriptional repressor
MHLTLYTDYTLRVMMYLAVKQGDGGVVTIDEMAAAYGIPRSNLTKIVHELAQNGFIVTTRGRTGGACLARLPHQISIGELVRMAEKDFAVVACHAAPREVDCAIMPACNLKNGLRRAVEAFLFELDKMTLQDAIITPSVAASLLRIRSSEGKEIAVPVTDLLTRKRNTRFKGKLPEQPAARGAPRRRSRNQHG